MLRCHVVAVCAWRLGSAVWGALPRCAVLNGRPCSAWAGAGQGSTGGPLLHRAINLLCSSNKAENEDDRRFDVMARELVFEAKAQPGDRTLSGARGRAPCVLRFWGAPLLEARACSLFRLCRQE